MKHLSEIFNITDFEAHITNGNISKRKHPKHDLYVLNYTNKVQYEQIWDNITLKCRGLIINDKYEIVADCLEKFFNYEEIENKNIKIDLCQDFIITDKLDGSYLSVFNYNNEIIFSTRGSFESEQAIEAQKIWNEKYSNVIIPENTTLIFEIIYPENRIVVNYGNARDLFLLTILGKSFKHPFNEVKRFYCHDFKNIRNVIKRDNAEGFVVYGCRTGQRFKLKYDEYCRLHKIMTGISEKTIWEWLKEGIDYKTILEKCPDEMYKWVDLTVYTINSLYIGVDFACKMLTTDCLKDAITKKDFALNVQKLVRQKEFWPIIFLMYDKKEYAEYIWKIVKPKTTKTFKIPKD